MEGKEVKLNSSLQAGMGGAAEQGSDGFQTCVSRSQMFVEYKYSPPVMESTAGSDLERGNCDYTFFSSGVDNGTGELVDEFIPYNPSGSTTAESSVPAAVEMKIDEHYEFLADDEGNSAGDVGNADGYNSQESARSKGYPKLSWSSTLPFIKTQQNTNSSTSEGDATDDQPTTTRLTVAATTKDKSKEKGKVRNMDLMQLPFSYTGQSFTFQAQKIILNVYEFFKTNRKDPHVVSRVGCPQDKASRCLNISSAVIGRIRKKYQDGKLYSPVPIRNKTRSVLDKVDGKMEEEIRRMFNEMTHNGYPPTVSSLLTAVKEKTNFSGCRTSFRRLLNKMGLKYGKKFKLPPNGIVVI